MNVSIYSRQKNEVGKWRFVRVNTGRGRRPVNDPTGPFYLRYTQTDGTQPFVSCGNTLDEAKKAAADIQPKLEEKAAEIRVERASNNPTIDARVASYNAETEANKVRRTAQAYANTLRYFVASCTKKYVDSVTREDLLKFKTDLKKEDLSDRTVYNHFLIAMVFLKWCGHKTGIKKNDWPAKPEREPEEYTSEEIVALLGAAKAEERLILNSLLCTGLRSGELAHLTYGNIDFKHSVWTVVPKEGWKTKTENSQRDVPVLEVVTKRIRKRMEARGAKPTDLIFPSTVGKPNGHLLRIVKRVAKRAKLTGRVDDHKFRSTAITLWLRNGRSLVDVMNWVGHTSLETVQRYAAKVNVRKAETVKLSGQAFEQFANVGGD